MKNFIFYNNQNGYHAEIIFAVIAENITEANTIFIRKNGYNPTKNPFISCCPVNIDKNIFV